MTEKSKSNDLETMSVEEIQEYVSDNIWKVRPCKDYWAEYAECDSIKMRFHNWFIHGNFGSCKEWKEDYNNCQKSPDDYRAFASIIKHEDERMGKRIKNHLANDIWEKRDSPPPDWNAELPEFLRERQKKSFLNDPEERKGCVIF